MPLIEEIHSSLSSIDIFQSLKEDSYPFLLDSGMNSSKLGRFSFIGSDPFLVFKSKKDNVELIEKGRTNSFRTNPFHILKSLLAEYSIPKTDLAMPFIGGAVGYFGYDLCHHIEKLPSRAVDDINIPDCIVGFYDSIFAIDHLLGKTYIVSTGFPEIEEGKRKERAKERLEELLRHCEEARRADEATEGFKPEGVPNPLGSANLNNRLKSNFTKSDYLAAIRKAKEYIARGDVYQVNLSQRFSSDLTIDPFELYKRLRSINPAPFAAYMDFGEEKIISASPERFLCVRNRVIHTRPIKGTRPRGSNPAEDEALAGELLASAKDRAEHLMIVDLERNDLGRVCKFGSVRPTEFIILEKYATVFHLVSTISGILRSDVDAVDCLLASFPGGSITGAPKIRSMEVIDELEPTKRSIYTGSIGYISFNGEMDSSIVIRTILVKGNKLYFQVGGGIVADSDPEAEYQETLDKAKALIDSLSLQEVK